MNKNTMIFYDPAMTAKKLGGLLTPDVKRYLPGDIILEPGGAEQGTGIIRSGLAYLLSINNDGEENILDYYIPGSLIGDIPAPDGIGNLYYIFARNETEVIFYSKKTENSEDKKITELIHDIEHDYFIQRLSHLQMHTDVLSQRSIRKKLMVYFSYLSRENDSSSFRLPMNLTDLANYIAADRSAMTREIRKMNNENIIVSDGANIIILKEK